MPCSAAFIWLKRWEPLKSFLTDFVSSGEKAAIMLGAINRGYFNILELKLYRYALFAENTGTTIQNKTDMCRVSAVNTFAIGACFSQTFFFRECVVSAYKIKRFIHSHKAMG